MTTPPPAWISVKSGNLPKPNQPFWIGYDKDADISIYLRGLSNPTALRREAYWLPAEIPPAPVIDEADEACLEWLKGDDGFTGLCTTERAKKIFTAGFNLGKAKGKA